MTKPQQPKEDGSETKQNEYIRKQAFVLLAIRRKLEEAAAEAEKLNIEFEEHDLRHELAELIDFIELVFARTPFMSALAEEGVARR